MSSMKQAEFGEFGVGSSIIRAEVDPWSPKINKIHPEFLKTLKCFWAVLVNILLLHSMDV